MRHCRCRAASPSPASRPAAPPTASWPMGFPNNERLITPALEYPLGETPITVNADGQALTQLAVQSDGDQATLLAVTTGGDVVLTHVSKQSSFLEESETWQTVSTPLPHPPMTVSYVLADPEQRYAYFANTDGELYFFDISDKQSPRLIQPLRVVPQGQRITALQFLAGGTSLLVGESSGTVSQWFPVRDSRNNFVLTRIRDFKDEHGAVSAIAAEHARKGFLAADADGNVAIYHTTAHRTLTVAQVARVPLTQLAVGGG